MHIAATVNVCGSNVYIDVMFICYECLYLYNDTDNG